MLEEVPNRAETTNAELATLLPRDSSRRTLERVGGETDLALKEVDFAVPSQRSVHDCRQVKSAGCHPDRCK